MYYSYCSRCNADGSYRHVDRDCGKCSGTGNDWRDDEEMGFGIVELRRKKHMIDEDGKEYFYKAFMPSLEEERARCGFRE